jgi:hypothetical protein
MCRQYLAYKIPTSHFTTGKCAIVKDQRLQSCSCGKFTFVILGRYRTKTDTIFVSKTRLSSTNKLYRQRYPFRIFKMSRGIKDGVCRTCGCTVYACVTQKKVNMSVLDVEQKLNMDLDSIIRHDRSLNPFEPIPEDWLGTGCDGDSLHDPTITKEMLDREMSEWEDKMFAYYSKSDEIIYI